MNIILQSWSYYPVIIIVSKICNDPLDNGLNVFDWNNTVFCSTPIWENSFFILQVLHSMEVQANTLLVVTDTSVWP